MSARDVAAAGRRFARWRDWWVAGWRGLGREMVRRWYLFVLLGAVWSLVAVRLFGSHTPFLPLLVNWTPSLPYHVVYVDYSSTRIDRGDLIVYAFSGQASEKDYPGLKHQPFFKRVVGMPGDVVSVSGREVFVNGAPVGRAKNHTFDRRPLEPIEPGVIPPGYVYVQGSSPDSFDSRYRSSGLVALSDIRTKVHPLL